MKAIKTNNSVSDSSSEHICGIHEPYGFVNGALQCAFEDFPDIICSDLADFLDDLELYSGYIDDHCIDIFCYKCVNSHCHES